MDISPLNSRYADSHALIIGIDKYKTAPPLSFAVSDAEAVADILKKQFGFPEKNVHFLTDKKATQSSIRQRFLSFASGGTDINDRVIVFFAGHGHTEPSSKGEVGFLVPYDGNPRDLSSMIRWDDLTRNADLIDAKHILFLMDACYGGLAITRAIRPGSMRFLKDMLLRRARQVLTAGKADEAVADSGGPLPDHSVFTGHLLEGLEGKAADNEGLITANGLMAYVYQKVGRDSNSQQTPHYGHLDGDGDMILSGFKLSEEQADEEKDQDILVSVPAVIQNGENVEAMTVIEKTKEYLAEERNKIKLHDLVSLQTRELLSLSAEDYFLQGAWSNEEFIERLKKYETIIADLCKIQALLAYWGSEIHRETLILPIKKISGRIKSQSGLTGWLALRWYPALLLLYASGIAAVAAGKYDNLRALMQMSVHEENRGRTTAIRRTVSALSEIHDAFKLLPGHERNYAPRSEYLFKFLQPMLDDLLFLGEDYESHFDVFEIFLALEHAEQYAREDYGRIWGPPGRFAWKRGALGQVIAEAEAQRDSWQPIKAGLFGGSFKKFKEISSEYQNMVSNLGWG